MKQQTRTLQHKPYNETAAESWDWVIWGLNGDIQSDWKHAAKRVSSLVLNMKELDAIRETLAGEDSKAGSFESTNVFFWPMFAFQNNELELLNNRGRQLSTKVNRQLRFYKWSPGITTPRFEERFREHPQFSERPEAAYQEKVAVLLLLDELCEGRINRFRVCRQCERWFYGVAAHQISCSEACRKKYGSTSEDFKAKRREYMKKYRKQEQAKNKRAKLQVKTQSKAR
jgi:hypothetical protein